MPDPITPRCPVADPYSLEQLTADLARARELPVSDFTEAELRELLDMATADAGNCDCPMVAQRHQYHGNQHHTDRYHQTLADVGASALDLDAAVERWRRKQALARSDDLAAHWPEIAGEPFQPRPPQHREPDPRCLRAVPARGDGRPAVLDQPGARARRSG